MEVFHCLILTMICVLTRVADVSGTHFRGGSISWAPVGNSGTQIEVRYRFGWRLNYEPHYLCTDGAIKNETMIEGEGELMLVKRNSEGDVLFEEIVKEPLDYICTDRFDEGSVGEFHWASGVNSFILDVDERMGTEFELGYFSCCWIGVLNYERPRRWKMLTKVDLTPRPDNQQLNSSPVTSSLPLLRIQRGCDFIVDIPYYDKDGDHVKCRWAKALKNECTPPNCGRAHQMFTITDGSCMVHIDSEVADIGWYAVALMIEDFITPFSSQALSAVPFHFLVRVDPGERRCNDVINTDPVNRCLAVPPGELFVYKATAKVMNPEIPIVNFASTSPRGMEKSSVTSEGGGLYSAEFNWVPSPKLVGTVETFCYSPFDSERFSGKEVCIDLAIGGVRPFPKANQSIPAGSETFSLSESTWQIAFDQEVTFNPHVTVLAKIIDTSNEEVVFNVTTEDVNADVEFNILVLTFWEPLVNILEENHVYELEVLPGIVNGKQLCMLPSTGASWTFNTCVQPFPDSARSVPSSSPENALSVLDFWNITFYHPVYLRTNISLIAQILDSDGIFLYNITRDDVTFTASDSNVISFLTPQWLYLEEGTEYQIRIPAGIAFSNEHCDMQSIEDSWKFNTTSTFIGGRRPPPTILDPKVSVLCFPTFMEIFIERDQFGLEMDPAVITLDDEYCYGMEHNDTHFRLGTTYGQCDTKALMNQDDSRVSMVNHVTIPSRAFPDESFNPYFPPLTPHPNYEIRVNCSIPSRRVSFVELNPNVSTIIFHSDQIGDFNFSLKMFPDEGYRNRYRVQDFPIDIYEDQRLYFEARAYAPKRYGPYLESCVAAPSSHPRDNSSFTFIRNGCPLSRSLQFHESPYKTRLRFSVLAEEFLQRGLSSYMFVHCDIRLCDRRHDECSSTCPTETNKIGPVLKRSIRSLAVSDEFMDTDGPIRIMHRQYNANDNQDQLPWLQITLTCITVVLSVVCFALVVMVMKLKSSIEAATNRTSHVRVPFAISIPTILPDSST